ncbi:MAG: hypothetical protein ABSA21_02900 [Candidatus Limnocylindrales bacterium]
MSSHAFRRAQRKSNVRSPGGQYRRAYWAHIDRLALADSVFYVRPASSGVAPWAIDPSHPSLIEVDEIRAFFAQQGLLTGQ